ncbi:unnamed protein product [Amoebophrya sp. A120]|nr:unnamed protein product [Amoebophrya sp. A120]|eukprot:GSA120T00006496001.1
MRSSSSVPVLLGLLRIRFLNFLTPVVYFFESEEGAATEKPRRGYLLLSVAGQQFKRPARRKTLPEVSTGVDDVLLHQARPLSSPPASPQKKNANRTTFPSSSVSAQGGAQQQAGVNLRTSGATTPGASVPPVQPVVPQSGAAPGGDEDLGEIERFLEREAAQKKISGAGGSPSADGQVENYMGGTSSSFDAATQVRRQCAAEVGTVWLYGDVDHMDTNTAEECCERCDLEPECTRWSFGFRGSMKGKCMLRNDESYASKEPEIVSGRRTTPLPTQTSAGSSREEL